MAEFSIVERDWSQGGSRNKWSTTKQNFLNVTVSPLLNVVFNIHLYFREVCKKRCGMGTSQKYSLRWNDFSINVATTFRDLHSRQVSCHPNNCMQVCTTPVWRIPLYGPASVHRGPHIIRYYSPAHTSKIKKKSVFSNKSMKKIVSDTERPVHHKVPLCTLALYWSLILHTRAPVSYPRYGVWNLYHKCKGCLCFQGAEIFVKQNGALKLPSQTTELYCKSAVQICASYLYYKSALKTVLKSCSTKLYPKICILYPLPLNHCWRSTAVPIVF